MKHRPLFEISQDIRKDWTKINYAAKPYLEAMESLSQITENYYSDSGKNIVLYFLSNAGSWRGEVAKQIKEELKLIVK